MSMNDALAGIPVDDDFNLADPAEYPDGGIEMLPAGTYDLSLTAFTPNYEDGGTSGKVTSIDMEMQVIGANDVKYLHRRTGRIRVFTKKFERKPGLFVSGFGDFVRGITDTEKWSGAEAGLDLLGKAKDRAIPIQIRLDWEAFDKKGFDAEGGAALERGSQSQKDLRKRATVKGMSNFPAYEDGTYRDSVEGPLSHEDLQARLVIRGVTPQSKRRTLAARL